MSFSVSVPATKKDEFADAANALTVPVTITSPEGTDMFNEARRAVIDLAATLSGPAEYIGCSINGHAWWVNDDSYPKNNLNISVFEADAPVEAGAA